MKRAKVLFNLLVVVLSICIICLVGAGCSDGDDTKPDLVLSNSSVDLDRYESTQLSVIDVPEGAVVQWSSSNDQVAVVSNEGLVQATGVGETTITAKVGKDSAECIVKVSNSGAIPTLKLSKTEINVGKDVSVSIDASVLYKGTDRLLFASALGDTRVIACGGFLRMQLQGRGRDTR